MGRAPEEAKIMKTIKCSFCGNTIQPKNGETPPDDSNGICESCFVQKFPHIAQRVLGDKEVEIK